MNQLSGPAFDGLYGQMIMDHYRTPRNREPLPLPTLTAYELNPFCGDLIDLQLHLDGNGAIDAVYANSEGCSIIQASSSMMSEAMKGRAPAEIIGLSADFREFLRDRAGASEPPRNSVTSALWVSYASTRCASSAPCSPGQPWRRPSRNYLKTADPPNPSCPRRRESTSPPALM